MTDEIEKMARESYEAQRAKSEWTLPHELYAIAFRAGYEAREREA